MMGSDLSDFIEMMTEEGDADSAAEVLALLAKDSTVVERVKPQLAKYREARAERQAKRDAAAYAKTEAGKRERAEADYQAVQDRNAEIEKAEHVLRGRGLGDDDLATLTAEEKLHSSGFRQIASAMSQDEKDAATLALAPKWGNSTCAG